MNKKLLRELPKVDELLADCRVAAQTAGISHQIVVTAIRAVIEQTRQSILNGTLQADRLDRDAIVERVVTRAAAANQMQLRPVINATGVVLHTNLGRAPLARVVVEKVSAVAAGYNTLEYDIASGGRGSRYSHVESLICQITGAEAALVVNNNAAAMMLILSALAKGREVVVSRGELVEIGGSFRVPEIMEQSGASLREIGTTNKTHFADYQGAINAATGMLLKVHTSNYRIVGFTEEVGLAQLAELGKAQQIPVVYDLGSGLIDDFGVAQFGAEITVKSSLKSGVDVVSFSGDKLLGGPQAGIIVGGRAIVEKLKRHPMTRALRIDKLTLTALEATLRLYLEDDVRTRVPVLNMLSLPPEQLAARARQLLALLKAADDLADLRLADGKSQVGGGSMPTVLLDTTLIAIRPKALSVGAMQAALRSCTVPIIVRVFNDCLYLDIRTVETADFQYVADQVINVLKGE